MTKKEKENRSINYHQNLTNLPRVPQKTNQSSKNTPEDQLHDIATKKISIRKLMALAFRLGLGKTSYAHPAQA